MQPNSSRSLKLAVLTGLYLALSSPAPQAHPGTLDAYGCHNEYTTGTYHCHEGVFAGRSFASKNAMLVALTGDPNFPFLPTYNRNDYLPSWADADGNCINTRHEVLIQESLIPVTMDARGCSVRSGLWYDPYTGLTFTDPSDLDIDHVVPLKEAHDSGAAWWPIEKKRAFANEIHNPLVLLAVDDATNSAKGDKDPARWLPPNTSFHCEYIKNWVAIKDEYELNIDLAEQAAIDRILSAGASALPYKSEGWSFTTQMNGLYPDVRFAIGLERNGYCGYFDGALLNEELTIVGTIHPPAHHRGKIVDLFVVDRVNMEFTMQTEDGDFIPWNTRVPDLVPTLRNAELAGSLTFKMFQGHLQEPGDHRFFLGYKVDGVLYFTPEPARYMVLQ